MFVRNVSEFLWRSSLIGLIAFAASDAVAAQDYVSGHGALQIWDAEGQANAPRWVQIWLYIMLAAFATGLLFVWRRVEARWVVGGFLAVVITAILSQSMTDIVPLSGFFALLHLVFWSPALFLLLTRRPFAKERSLYAAWSALITGVILFSFIFDIRDAAIYLDHITGVGLFS
ncbi:MAG: hypothetical protein AAGJ87_12755 [Pseudomonadota bacterium]